MTDETTEPILQFFAYEHLPPHLQMVSRPFGQLAHAIARGDNNAESGTVTFGSALPRNPERTVALRKLLEAKDAAVRALLFKSVAVLLFLVIASSVAIAQEPTPTPTPRPAIELSLHGGAMQFLQRDSTDRKDFVYRISLTVPVPGEVTLFGRADYTRTQDGGDLLDPKSFRSIEGFVGGRRDIAPNLAVTAFTGVSWDRDKEFVPADPRLWTAAAGLKYSLPGRGYVIAAVAHHGPVGGLAFLGSAVWEMSAGAAWFGDIAVPLKSAEFIKNPYTVKCGISGVIWRKRFPQEARP